MVKVGAVVVLYNPDFDVTKKTLSSLASQVDVYKRQKTNSCKRWISLQILACLINLLYLRCSLMPN